MMECPELENISRPEQGLSTSKDGGETWRFLGQLIPRLSAHISRLLFDTEFGKTSIEFRAVLLRTTGRSTAGKYGSAPYAGSVVTKTIYTNKLVLYTNLVAHRVTRAESPKIAEASL